MVQPCTELPSKDEISETTVRNLFSLFCYILDFLTLWTLVYFPKAILKLEDQILPSDNHFFGRHYIKAYSLWVTLYIIHGWGSYSITICEVGANYKHPSWIRYILMRECSYIINIYIRCLSAINVLQIQIFDPSSFTPSKPL